MRDFMLPAADAGTRMAIAPRVYVALPDEQPKQLLERIRHGLFQANETGLLLVIYGRRECLADLAVPIDLPVMILEGRPCHPGPLAGAFVYVCPAAMRVQPIRMGGRTRAMVVEDGEARYCLFGGFGTPSTHASRSEQTRQAFEQLEQTLIRAGFSIGDVIRTWFYNDDILAWYPEFNRVRTAFYRRQAFATGSTPASTGVGGAYSDGAALGLSGWAFQSREESTQAIEVASPLQCPALNYGSSFSRAMELRCRGERRLFVSGTASIALSGESIWQGNIERQIDRTMEVIAAMLSARDFGWADVDRATAYFKSATDYPHWVKWLERHDLTELPCVAVEGTVCRDDLLFELEVDAAAPSIGF